MNCAECRDEMAACLEDLLDAGEAKRRQLHLQNCAACRAEFAAFRSLQQLLRASAATAADVALEHSVMQRIRQRTERTSIMRTLLKYRWGFGLGAAATCALIIALAVFSSPNAHAKAADVMARGAKAVARLTSLHLRGELRTLPADNFSYINPDQDFQPIELWKQFTPELKWRAEKPGRLVLMDGNSTVLYIKSAKIANSLPTRSTSAFDTDWLHRIGNLSNAITNELKNALARGWKLGLTEERGADGHIKAIVTVNAQSGVPANDYLKNSFLENADTRRVYQFDSESELLESVQVYLVRPPGEVLMFRLTSIEYNQAIDPSIWKLDIPAETTFVKPPEKLADNEKYAAMSPEEAARTFFEACSREDWTEAAKFESALTKSMKQYLGGLEIVSLGKAFTSEAYGGRFIPYEIKFRPVELNMRVSNDNPAKRYVLTGLFDRKLQVMQELIWTNALPLVLPDNAAYAKMTPSEVVCAYFDAQSKLDWAEMLKFAPDYDVANDRRQVEAAQKQGLDLQAIMPKYEVGEAFWSKEHSCYFVKCKMAQTKKWNLALRKDNSAGRWQVDGGL